MGWEGADECNSQSGMVARGHGSTNLHSLGKVLKRPSDIEEDFTLMNEDIKRVKAVLGEKLALLGMSRTRPE